MVVLRKIVFLAVKGELSACYPVGIRPYDRSEKTFTRVVDIALDIVITELYILIVPLGRQASHLPLSRNWTQVSAARPSSLQNSRQ